MATVQRKVCTKCGQNRALKFYVGPRGRVCGFCRKSRTRAASKDTRLQATFNITHEQWLAVLESQGGTCAICDGKRPTYDTDHDHKMEKAGFPIEQTIRGLLCKRCNRRLLPSCKDDITLLLLAIDYLRYGRNRTQAVLHAFAPKVD